MIHAHVSKQSRDCDGDYSSGHVAQPTFEEQDDQNGDLHFQERVVADTINLHGTGTLKVTPDGVSWHEETDEGYRAAEVRWCTDDCPEGNSWRRDHRAEEAGY